MKKQILKLREQGKTYKEICDTLGCSKSTVSYHCGEGQKEKTRTRARKHRKENVVAKRVDSFKHPTCARFNRRKKTAKSSNKKLLRHKADDFQRREKGVYRLGKRNTNFTYKDVLKKYTEETTCYLTGRNINLTEPRTYNFDHVVPASKGGDNSFENLGICCREANVAKGDLSVEKLLDLCKEILEHNGYEVTQN